MSGVVVNCATCGASYEPDRLDIIRGRWKVCPSCRASAPDNGHEGEIHCRECGRPLRTAGRAICLRCLGIAIV